jgi:SAM-dependent MidA family methyltransferase
VSFLPSYRRIEEIDKQIEKLGRKRGRFVEQLKREVELYPKILRTLETYLMEIEEADESSLQEFLGGLARGAGILPKELKVTLSNILAGISSNA